MKLHVCSQYQVQYADVVQPKDYDDTLAFFRKNFDCFIDPEESIIEIDKGSIINYLETSISKDNLEYVDFLEQLLKKGDPTNSFVRLDYF